MLRKVFNEWSLTVVVVVAALVLIFGGAATLAPRTLPPWPTYPYPMRVVA